MARLTMSLSAWGRPDFEAVLCREIERLDPAWLPLQQGLSIGSHALGEGLRAMVLGVRDTDGTIGVRVGLFFTAVIAGCSCEDDPTPVDAVNEYCEVRIDIDKATGEGRAMLLASD